MRLARRALAALGLAALVAAPAGAQSPAERWPDFEVILWHRPAAEHLHALPPLGVTASVIFGQRSGIDAAAIAPQAAALKAAGLGWYVENIATDFYSPYHRWMPNRPVEWAFTQAKRRYRANPRDLTVFEREPSLSDPAWLARIEERLAAHARLHRELAAPGRPLFLDLADEPGIGDLNAAWDFDIGADSLAGFREWLRGEYPSLAALNAQWGTAFAGWADVRPELTDATLARTDGNHSAWSDFKAWMDVAFARAVLAGRRAVNGVDPAMLAAIAGGQRPGWGGWDYARLSGTVDLLETYDLDVGRAVALGLDPGLVVLMTSGAPQDPKEWHRIWRQALRGVRGLVVWDGQRDVITAQGQPGAMGSAAAPLFAGLRDGLPAQIFAATEPPGAVGILYSQASYRMRWLLDRQAERRRGGPRWWSRTSGAEHRDDNAWRMALQRGIRALAQQGVTPRWLTPETLAAGVPAELRVLILPHAIALSDAEVAAVRAFAARGGTVVADAAAPAVFDGRGRRRARPALEGMAIQRPEAMLRSVPDADPAPRRSFDALLRDAGAAPDFRYEGPGAEIRSLTNGVVRLIALQRDADATGSPFPRGGEARFAFAQGWHLRPLGAGAAATPGQQLSVSLDPIRPAAIVVSPAPLPRLVVTGDAATFRLGLDGPSPAAAHVLRVELVDAAGATRQDRGWNLVWRGTRLDWTPPEGHPGLWTLRVTDLLGGDRIERPLELAR